MNMFRSVSSAIATKYASHVLSSARLHRDTPTNLLGLSVSGGWNIGA